MINFGRSGIGKWTIVVHLLGQNIDTGEKINEWYKHHIKNNNFLHIHLILQGVPKKTPPFFNRFQQNGGVFLGHPVQL